MTNPKRVMTIAGSAAGGSAGIQADLKTFQELDVYGMSVVTAIVGRHPETGRNVHPQSIEAIEGQFATAQRQVGIDALKTGMLFSEEVIHTVAELIKGSDMETVVIDPVMVGKMDSKLLKKDAIEALKDDLIPQSTMITPNIPEARFLLDEREITTIEEMKIAAKDLHELGPNYVLVKGGRLEGPATDVLYDGRSFTLFEAPRIDTVNTSGAGCSYSAGITALLAKGMNVEEAVAQAKTFITTAIANGFTYTKIVGPTYHAAQRKYGDSYKIKIEKSS
jgi:pyridoxine kinase/hydroxymethylpyrimidine/phosphomethylpyrimidine kinase